MRKRVYIRPVGVVLSEEIHKQLIDLSIKKEVSISEWIRRAIEAKLKAISSQEEGK